MQNIRGLESKIRTLLDIDPHWDLDTIARKFDRHPSTTDDNYFDQDIIALLSRAFMTSIMKSATGNGAVLQTSALIETAKSLCDIIYTDPQIRSAHFEYIFTAVAWQLLAYTTDLRRPVGANDAAETAAIEKLVKELFQQRILTGNISVPQKISTSRLDNNISLTEYINGFGEDRFRSLKGVIREMHTGSRPSMR